VANLWLIIERIVEIVLQMLPQAERSDNGFPQFGVLPQGRSGAYAARDYLFSTNLDLDPIFPSLMLGMWLS
jgi:hypothetical protein